MRHFILAIILLYGLTGNTQSLSRQVIGNSGEIFTSASTQISWTVGEIATQTISDGTNQITQGFQQPEINTANSVSEGAQTAVTAYPNPVQDDMHLKLCPMTDVVSLKITSVTGKLMDLISLQPGASVYHISMANYASGIYSIEIIGQGQFKPFQIIKSN